MRMLTLLAFGCPCVSCGMLALPPFGLGLGWHDDGHGTIEGAILAFLRAGGRLLDTAIHYGNHDAVRRAIVASGIPRRELFIVTKLGRSNVGYEPAAAGAALVCKELGTAPDLLLYHHPDGGGSVKDRETWRAMQKAKEAGKCRHIGVSNMGLSDTISLAGVEAVEVEYHPWAPLSVKQLVAHCQRHGIAVIAYGVLGGSLFKRGSAAGSGDWPLEVQRVASTLGVSSEAALLLWVRERGVTPLFGSRTPAHIEANIRVLTSGVVTLGTALSNVMERSRRPTSFREWGGTKVIRKSRGSGSLDCLDDWMRFVDSELHSIRQQRERGKSGQGAWATFNVSQFAGLSGPPCIVPASLRIELARQLTLPMAVASRPFVVLPPHVIFDEGPERRDGRGDALAKSRAVVSTLDAALCAVPSNGLDRRLAHCEEVDGLCNWFHRSPLLAEMALQYMHYSQSTAWSKQLTPSKQNESLCRVVPYHCAHAFKAYGPRVQSTAAGITPLGASSGGGWHVDHRGGPRIKSMMYLTDVLAAGDGVFTMVIDYPHERLPSLACTAHGANRCAYPTCDVRTITKSRTRLNAAAVQTLLEENKATAVRLYGPAGTIIFFDGQSLHAGQLLTGPRARLSITNHHRLSWRDPPENAASTSATQVQFTEATTMLEQMQRRCLTLPDATSAQARTWLNSRPAAAARSSLREPLRWKQQCASQLQTCKVKPMEATSTCTGARTWWLMRAD